MRTGNEALAPVACQEVSLRRIGLTGQCNVGADDKGEMEGIIFQASSFDRHLGLSSIKLSEMGNEASGYSSSSASW